MRQDEYSSEGSCGSYILRKCNVMKWNVILRGIPKEYESTLEHILSNLSVSLEFSLPSSVIFEYELCIVNGNVRIAIITFPSRSSTRYFLKKGCNNSGYLILDKNPNNLSIIPSCLADLYVTCEPSIMIKPFQSLVSMNMATQYWLIRGISHSIEEEHLWQILRKNRYGSYLRRIHYIKDESKKTKGFCFVQFSSPLTSLRALRWLKKHSNLNNITDNKNNSFPFFIGTSQIYVLLEITKELESFEPKSVNSLWNIVNSDNTKISDLKREIWSNYMKFWTKTYNSYLSVNSSSEYNQIRTSEVIEIWKDLSSIIFCEDFNLIYINKSISWNWKSRIFIDITNRTCYEYDSEYGALILILNQTQPFTIYNEKSEDEKDIGVDTLAPKIELIFKDNRELIASVLANTQSQLHSNSVKIQHNKSKSESINKGIKDFFSIDEDYKEEAIKDNINNIDNKLNISDNSSSKIKQNEKCTDDTLESEIDRICFVCCRIFKNFKDKVNHEQYSSIHKYNLGT
ncbi:uncharacterized protein CMU_006510 [Cryptosporidium muris RN66]|uniref:RRM domain-containing protein n=1 Tax=Cryptosporidium muris (strain RN66) TaxID=441375 RepID=B6AHN3_CRYMR|nr:uncharacterized protein CMU_006510 [Cryptosporidium muris RN66]EEA07728.1 hypothetical protein, conserved [Cryptosporidium muris RN66]|eukprot:XP_002142077.1 hypothetical protein [Cryptosporidium muris RN66]